MYPARIIKDEYRESLTDDTKIRDRWRDCFKLFMNVKHGRVDRYIIAVEGGQMDEVSEGEVERALKSMKRGKAVESDDVSAETWKCLGTQVVIFFTKNLKKY